jgi:hypothetical protein
LIVFKNRILRGSAKDWLLGEFKVLRDVFSASFSASETRDAGKAVGRMRARCEKKNEPTLQDYQSYAAFARVPEHAEVSSNAFPFENDG